MKKMWAILLTLAVVLSFASQALADSAWLMGN